MNIEQPEIPTPEKQSKEKKLQSELKTNHDSLKQDLSEQKGSPEYQNKKVEFFKALNQHEVELRPEQVILLSRVTEEIRNILGKHGISKELGDVITHIHFVKPDFYKDFSRILGEDPMTDKEVNLTGGAYSSHFGEAVLTWNATETHSEFTIKVAHELLHFFQHDNRKEKKGEDSLDQESLGMMLESEGRMLFGNILEAVTQKLAIEVVRDIQDPVVVEEHQNLKELFDKSPEGGYFLGYQVRGQYGYVHELVPRIAYKNHLQKFDEMMKEIYEKNTDQFQTIDDVFEIFVQAAYGGEKLPFARLINRTYGTKLKILKRVLTFFGKESPLREVGKDWDIIE